MEDKYLTIRQELKDLKKALRELKAKGTPQLQQTRFEMPDVTVSYNLGDSLVMFNNGFDFYPFNFAVIDDGDTARCSSYRFRGYVTFTQSVSDFLRPNSFVRFIVFVRHRNNGIVPDMFQLLEYVPGVNQVNADYHKDYRKDFTILHDVYIRDDEGQYVPITAGAGDRVKGVVQVPFEISGSCDLLMHFKKGAAKPVCWSNLDALGVCALRSDDGVTAKLDFYADNRWRLDRSFH